MLTSRPMRLFLTLIFLAISGFVGCSAGTYVWVQDLPQSPAATPGDYLINTGDTVGIRVLGNDTMTTRAKVRTDGRVAIPILGDVEVRGKRPSAVRAELEARLKEYLNAPSVTVNVEEFQPVQVSVLGEVGHPGVYTIDPTASVATVLAAAGSLTEFADRDRIFVLRSSPSQQRIRFTWEGISRGDTASARFSLRPGDVIVVE